VQHRRATAVQTLTIRLAQDERLGQIFEILTRELQPLLSEDGYKSDEDEEAAGAADPVVVGDAAAGDRRAGDTVALTTTLAAFTECHGCWRVGKGHDTQRW